MSLPAIVPVPERYRPNPQARKVIQDVFATTVLAKLIFGNLCENEQVTAVVGGAFPTKELSETIKKRRIKLIDKYVPKIAEYSPNSHLALPGYFLSVVLGGIMGGLVSSAMLAPIFLLIPLAILILSGIITASDKKYESKYEENEKLRTTLINLRPTASFSELHGTELVERAFYYEKDPQDTQEGPGELRGGDYTVTYQRLSVNDNSFQYVSDKCYNECFNY